MTVTINGKEQTFASTHTVATLLATLKIDPNRVAVEHNRQIVPREGFEKTAINDGDALEIVQFVGGG